jgi:hypothetical protein
MPTLSDRLAAMREKADTILKSEVEQLLERHIDELRSGAATNRPLKAGDIMPA